MLSICRIEKVGDYCLLDCSYCPIESTYRVVVYEVQDRKGKFKDFNIEIANTAKSAMKKYNKHHTSMDDSCDILYIAMLLRPSILETCSLNIS